MENNEIIKTQRQDKNKNYVKLFGCSIFATRVCLLLKNEH